MTKEEHVKLQKDISEKMLQLIQKDCACPRLSEKLKALNEALDALNRAAYYLVDQP